MDIGTNLVESPLPSNDPFSGWRYSGSTQITSSEVSLPRMWPTYSLASRYGRPSTLSISATTNDCPKHFSKSVRVRLLLLKKASSFPPCLFFPGTQGLQERKSRAPNSVSCLSPLLSERTIGIPVLFLSRSVFHTELRHGGSGSPLALSERVSERKRDQISAKISRRKDVLLCAGGRILVVPVVIPICFARPLFCEMILKAAEGV